MDNGKQNFEGCHHCWHAFRGTLCMVLPDGHTVQQCCKCHTDRVIHIDHAYEGKAGAPHGY